MAPRHAERRHLHNIFIPNLSLGTKKKNSPRITRITRIWFDQSKRNKIVCENLCFLCHLPLNYFINSVCGDGAKRSRGLFPFYLPPLKMPNVLPQGTPALFNLVKVKSLSPLTRLLAGVPVQEFTMPGIFTAKELSGGPAVRLTSCVVFPCVRSPFPFLPFATLCLCLFVPLHLSLVTNTSHAKLTTQV